MEVLFKEFYIMDLNYIIILFLLVYIKVSIIVDYKYNHQHL